MTQDSQEINELALPPGFALGNYIIRRVIGQGGFGITYLAVDQDLQTEVVIKENMPGSFAGRSTTSRQVFSLSHASDDFAWARDRFIQEARTMAKLNHRNIVRVTRVFQALGTAYYVMPYVGGMSLDKIVSKEGPLSEARLRPLLCSLLEALQYLHSKELLHRDIKPANILLDEEGEPILIDFGAARQLSQHSQTVVESPGYTPFEQMQTHGEIGPWTDLYALGGTMYKLITGQTPMRSMDRVGKDTLAPLADRADLRSRYSRSFLKGIDKALAFDARKRWQTAEEWQQSLSAGRKTSSTSRRPASTEVSATAAEPVHPPRKRTKRILLWSAAVTVLVGVVSLLCLRDDLLWVSCRDGNKTMASLMLTVGADIEAKNDDGWTPLIKAACNGHEAIVRLLLAKGADPEARPNSQETACDLTEREEIKKILKEAIARKYIRAGISNNISPDSMLLRAAEIGAAEVVEILLDEYAANIEAKGGDFKATPLLFAVLEGHEDAVRILLARGANVEARDESRRGRTALHTAIAWGRTTMIPLLLEKNAADNAQDKQGATPLLLAAASGNTVAVRLLLEKSADIRIVAEDGSTPLHEAAKRGHTDIVELLLLKGADPDFKNKAGKTAWDLAEKEEIKKLLRKAALRRQVAEQLSNGKTRDALLLEAAAEGETDVVELLIDEYEAEIEMKDKNGQTPLIQAIAWGHESVVRMLLEKGANIETTDEDGRTPLIKAAFHGHEAIVRLLLEKGAKIEAKDNDGDTPLIEAANWRHPSIVRMLLEKGAKIEAKNHKGWTPLIQAAWQGYEPIVRMLLEKGANIEATGKEGWTPLIAAAGVMDHDFAVRMFAKKKGDECRMDHEAVVRLLLEKGANVEAKDNLGLTAYDVSRTETIRRLIRSHQRSSYQRKPRPAYQ